MNRPSELWLSSLIIALALPAHLIGLLTPSIYRDPPVLLPQNLGTDLVTLCVVVPLLALTTDRKSTRLNSSHGYISYVVFCLQKKTFILIWSSPIFPRNSRF